MRFNMFFSVSCQLGAVAFAFGATVHKHSLMVFVLYVL